jgi:RNA polymerase sigma factor (sigma-70 family)
MLHDTNNKDAVHWENLGLGDMAALGCLYDLYAGRLFEKACSIVGSRAAAKDLVQDVFLHLWQYRTTVSTVQYSYSYLCKVLYSSALKNIKKERKTVYIPLPENIDSGVATIENLIISGDTASATRQKLNAAIAKLSSRQQQILQLHYTDGLSYAQIAEKLRINYQSVNNLAFRTMHQLRNFMLFLLLYCCF